MVAENIFRYDPKNERLARQENNNYKALQVIYGNEKVLNTNINTEELKRVCSQTNLSQENLFLECKNNKILAEVLAGRIAVNATRQGKIDEATIINGIGRFMKDHGYDVKSLPVSGDGSISPIKSGGLIYGKIKDKDKRKDCLKTLDGQITGKIDGFISAKVCIDSGGHQDNVKVEIIEFINWARNESKDKIYVVLLDGNSTVEYQKYIENTPNIWVVDHVAFQDKLINLENNSNV